MNLLSHCICYVTCFTLVIAQVSSKTKLNDSDNNTFPQKLLPLIGKMLVTSYNDTKYSVVIAQQNVTASIVVSEERKNIISALGRSNETTWMQSDSWILVKYGGGDSYSNSSECNGTMNTNILIRCDLDIHEPVLTFVGHNKQWKKSCFYMFELVTCIICPPIPDGGLSRGSVFCIIFLTSVGVYLIIGICYRRMVVGAKGFEQIPHHKFWTRLGNLQADGCNLVCRREEEETWQRLTSNPKDTQDDQDDALLRP